MNLCPSCGHEHDNNAVRCPECGSFYSKIIEMIDAEAADEEKHTLRGRCKRILDSGDIKLALLQEWQQIKAGLSKQALFALFVIFAFVFALIITVL
ncbi:MAG: hypothetical protein Q7U57_02710 [Methylovulum sp.]|nr:hypothetical protein [Methylovulum sp.]